MDNQYQDKFFLDAFDFTEQNDKRLPTGGQPRAHEDGACFVPSLWQWWWPISSCGVGRGSGFRLILQTSSTPGRFRIRRVSGSLSKR